MVVYVHELWRRMLICKSKDHEDKIDDSTESLGSPQNGTQFRPDERGSETKDGSEVPKGEPKLATMSEGATRIDRSEVPNREPNLATMREGAVLPAW